MNMNGKSAQPSAASNRLIEEFSDYLLGIQGRSPLTVKEYRYDLVLFFRFLLEREGLLNPELPFEEQPIASIDLERLKQLRLSDLHAFIGWLSVQRNASAANRSRKCATLRSFFKYLHSKAQLLPINPAAELESPKLPKRLPQHLDVEESLILLHTQEQKQDPFLQNRDFCILVLFLNCGLRLAELCGLNLSDWREDRLRVIGKGGKERTVYLNSACMDALLQYDSIRKRYADPEEVALFLTRQGKRLTRHGVQYLVKQSLLRSGLDTRKYSVHKLRHTAATLMYKYGKVDIRALQQILGHQSVSTTEIYTHLDRESLQEAVDKNPLAQVRRNRKSEPTEM